MIKAENKSHVTEDICYYVTVDNHPWAYLFDCGMARYLGASDCKSLRAIFITHTHIDHFCNFDTVLRHQLGINRTITICGPKGIARNVQAKALCYTWNLIKRRAVIYEVRELEEDQINIYELYPPHWELIKKDTIRTLDHSCLVENGVVARYAVLDHKIPSIAYLLEKDSSLNIGNFPFKPGPWIRDLKEAYANDQKNVDIFIDEKTTMKSGDLFQYLYIKPGEKFGYAMDHLASKQNHEKMIELWKDADELVIEGFFRECDRPFALRHYHSTVKESGKVARLAGIKKLTLAHHSRRYIKELDDLREEGYAEFEGREPKFKNNPVSRYEKEDGCDE